MIDATPIAVRPAASADIDELWRLYLWIAYGVTALVAVLMMWVIVRYRRRGDDLPPQKHYNIPVS